MATYYVDQDTGSDANAGTAPGAGNAWATIGHALSTATGASDVVWVKDSVSPYNVAASITFPSARNDLPNVAPYYILGYGTTTGDNVQPTITTSSAIDLVTLNGNNVFFGNFVLDGNGFANNGVRVAGGDSGRGTRLANLVIKNCKTRGIYLNSGSPCIITRVLVQSLAAGATSAIGGTSACFISDSAIVSCPCHGISFEGNNLGMLVASRMVIANSGAGVFHGIHADDSLANSVLRNLSIYNMGSDGVNMAGTYEAVAITDCVLAKNGGYGINGGYSTTVANTLLNQNAYGWPNTSGNLHNVIAGPDDVTLTGDPFVNPSGTVATLADVWANFALNSTAGAGAACRAAAYPPYLDLGAVQHQDSGGGGSTVIVIDED